MSKIIALTFDDGPNNYTTPQILDLLEEYGGKASFFLIGKNITEETIDVIKREVYLGCDVENHSFTHSYMTKLSKEETVKEIEETDALIKEITGKEPLFFRPPYIDYDESLFESIPKVFISGFGSNDWDENVSIDERVGIVKEQACDGAIILLHDQPDNVRTVEALKYILPDLREEGYEFVTISDLFYKKGKDPESEEMKKEHKIYEKVEG